MSTAEKVLSVLADVAEVEEVRRDPDLRLYDLDILDSLKTVELIVAFSEKLGVEISPAELEREQWATPRKIVAFMEDRVGR
jgi:D-alanine--poly(phosphoribitol) ligase subunit 2